MELPEIGSIRASVRKDDAFIHPPVLKSDDCYANSTSENV